MIIVENEKSISKESIIAMDELTKNKKVTPIQVLSFWKKYGILIPTRDVIEKLKKRHGIV
jgi:hypothetical protein